MRRVFRAAHVGIWVAVAVVCWSGAAQAIVHDEAIRTEPLVPGLHTELKTTVAAQTGSIPFFDLGGGLRLEWGLPSADLSSASGMGDAAQQERLDVVAVSLNGHYNEWGGDIYANRAFGYFKWTQYWSQQLGIDAFSQVEYNDLL